MRFYIRFVYHIQSVNIAQLYKQRIGRIMRSPDGVHIVFFKYFYVAFNLLRRQIIACFGIRIMMIGAQKFDFLAVKQENSAV